MSRPALRNTLASLAAAVTLVLAGALPAGAATAADHCAVGTAAASDGQSAPIQVHCFGTETEMWAFLTGAPGEASRSSAAKFNQRSAAGAAPAAATASVVLGIEFDNSSFGGQSLTLYGTTGTGCGGGSTYGFPSMSSYGWNDRISSATAYNGCRSQHYANASYGGASITCSSSCSSMGSLNDQTSSIVFRP